LVRLFDDAHKSPLSLLVLDNIEVMLDYVTVQTGSGSAAMVAVPRFSNAVLQTLLALLKKPPKEGRKLLVIATTNQPQMLKELNLKTVFQLALHVPQLERVQQLKVVVDTLGLTVDEKELEEIGKAVLPIGIKQLLMLIDMSLHDNVLSLNRLLECLDRTVRSS